MSPRIPRLLAAAALAASALEPRPAEGKVVFTGYGNFQFAAHQTAEPILRKRHANQAC